MSKGDFYWWSGGPDTLRWVAGGAEVYLRFTLDQSTPRPFIMPICCGKRRRKQLFNPHSSLYGFLSCRQWKGTNLWPFILRQFKKRVDVIQCRQRDHPNPSLESLRMTMSWYNNSLSPLNCDTQKANYKAYRKKEEAKQTTEPKASPRDGRGEVNVFSTWLIKIHAIVSAFWYSIQIKRHEATLKLRIEWELFWFVSFFPLWSEISMKRKKVKRLKRLHR